MTALTITYERRNAYALNSHAIPDRAGTENDAQLLQLGRRNLPAVGNALPTAVIPHPHQLQVFPGSGTTCQPKALSIHYEQQLRRNENEKSEWPIHHRR